MLRLIVGETELFDEEKQEFSKFGGYALELEHSLVALSKWEEKHEKPFLGPGDRTEEELFDYVKCMTLNDFPSEEIYTQLTSDDYKVIAEYMNAKMTATWFSEAVKSPKSSEIITAELVYHWMIEYKIPFECQYWHLNKLFTLIQVRNVKLDKPKKMSRAQIAERNRALNAKRKAELNTSG